MRVCQPLSQLKLCDETSAGGGALLRNRSYPSSSFVQPGVRTRVPFVRTRRPSPPGAVLATRPGECCIHKSARSAQTLFFLSFACSSHCSQIFGSRFCSSRSFVSRIFRRKVCLFHFHWVRSCGLKQSTHDQIIPYALNKGALILRSITGSILGYVINICLRSERKVLFDSIY